MSKFTETINKKYNLKKWLTVVLIIILIILALFAVSRVMGRAYDRTNFTYTEVVIKDGDTTAEIAATLKKNGIIENTGNFEILSALGFRTGKYKSGTYFLSPCMNFSQISHELINGITTNSGFTLPAGYTVNETILALDQAGISGKDDLKKVVETVDFSSFSFIDPNVDSSVRLEGFLYPDTYKMDSNASAIMVITTMLNQFDNNYTAEFKARAEELGLTTRQVITIASIIEKETKIDKEKATISSVIHNKINMNIPFEGGFPQNPLCSPGLESIKAALYPEETEYLYYTFSDKLNGSHVFATDEAQLETLKATYQSAKEAKQSKKN